MTIVINEEDIGKTEIQLLMDLIYESASIRVPEQKIQYGKPTELDFRPDVDDDPNTFIPVVIDPNYDDRFTPDANNGLLYRRREISTHLSNVSYTFLVQTDTFKLFDVLDQLNQQVSYPLTPADILDQTLTVEGLTNIVVKTNPDSYIWIGSVNITVNIRTTDKILLLGQTDLQGF